MKRRAQCSLTDYYGLANGRGYLRLICFIFVPFISCCSSNKLFLFPPSFSKLQPPFTTHLFQCMVSPVGHCRSSTEHTMSFCQTIKVLCHWANQLKELPAPDETRSASEERHVVLQVHWMVGTWLNGRQCTPCRGHRCSNAHTDTAHNRLQNP